MGVRRLARAPAGHGLSLGGAGAPQSPDPPAAVLGVLFSKVVVDGGITPFLASI